jgi:hypothetical protein
LKKSALSNEAGVSAASRKRGRENVVQRFGEETGYIDNINTRLAKQVFGFGFLMMQLVRVLFESACMGRFL